MTRKDKQRQSAREMANRIARALSEPTKAEAWVAVIRWDEGYEIEIYPTEQRAHDHIALLTEFEGDEIIESDVVPMSLRNLRNEYGEVDIEPCGDVDGREYMKRPTVTSWPEGEPDDTGYIPPYSAPPGFNRTND